MKAKTMYYPIYEGNFLTVAPILDRTVNILMFRDPDGQEYRILINRAMLGEDQSPEEFCEAQMDILRNDLPGFQLEGKMLNHEIGPAKMPVVQVANRYLENGQVVRQVQSILCLPWHETANSNTREVVIFTLHTEVEFTEYQRKHYVQVLNSFNPDTAHTISAA